MNLQRPRVVMKFIWEAEFVACAGSHSATELSYPQKSQVKKKDRYSYFIAFALLVQLFFFKTLYFLSSITLYSPSFLSASLTSLSPPSSPLLPSPISLFFPSCPIYQLFILLKFLSSNFVSLYSFPILMPSSITSGQTTPKSKTSLPRVFPQASSVLPTNRWNFAFLDPARLMKATHFLRLEPWDVWFFPGLCLVSRILPRLLMSVFLALRRPPPPLP